jgi:hypothetical protein
VEASFDVFLGHATVDKAAGVREFADRLKERGLRVFVDEREIAEYGSITREVEQALEGSLAFVAWYSAEYPSRRACQLELRAAYVAAEGAREVGERIFVVNPEDGFEHIYPLTLRDARIPRGDAAEAVAGRVEALRQRQAEPLGAPTRFEPPSWVPQRRVGSPHFVGRVPELWELHGHLQARKIAQISGTRREDVALVGPGGSGKSLLAEEYAHSFGPAYPGGVYWLFAVGAAPGGQGVLLDQLTVVAAALGLSLDDQPEPAVLKQRLASALAEREPALWLVDDLPGGLSAGEAQAWAAPHEQAATLITTRSSDYTAFATVELRVLDEQSAFDLLTSGLEPIGEEELQAARQIAVEVLGRHAQALDVASSLISERAGSDAYREFLRRTREGTVVERLEHAAAITAQLPNGHEASIVATYRAAIEDLDDQARDLLRVASQLAPAPIELDLAAEITAGEGETIDSAADRIDVAFSHLRRSSLARPIRTAADRPAYLVHALVAAVAQHIDPPPDRERADAFRVRATEILAAWFAGRDDLYDLTRAAQLESRLAHARHLVAGLAQSDDVSLVHLAYMVAQLDYLRGAYPTARRLQEEVLAACVRLLGEEHLETLTSKNNLAGTLVAQGDLEGARRLHGEVLAGYVRLLGEEHQHTLTSKNNLAATLVAQGDLESARRLHEDVLAGFVRLLGEEHPQTLTSKNNLAETLAELGDLESARRLQEEVLAAFVRQLGEEHPQTLTSKNNLAATLRAQGDLEGARQLHEEELAALVRLLGDEHPSTLLSKNNLAETLRAQGDLESARRLHDEVLAAFVRRLGEDHPYTLTSKNNLAGTLAEQGDLEGARRLHEEVMAARVRLLGEEHPGTLTSKDNVATTLADQGDLDGARRLHEEVLASRVRLFGEEHPDTLTSKDSLAATLRAQGDLEDARRLAEEALAARVRLLGEEHPDTLTSKNSLAATLWEQRDVEGARRLAEEVLAARVRLLGEAHPDTLTSKNNLAQALLAQGDLVRARRLQEDVLAARTRLLGEEHPDTQASKDTLAVTVRVQRDLEGAGR